MQQMSYFPDRRAAQIVQNMAQKPPAVYRKTSNLDRFRSRKGEADQTIEFQLDYEQRFIWKMTTAKRPMINDLEMSETKRVSSVRAYPIRIGISGWRYGAWRGKFYPKDLPQNRELDFAAETFNSLEINGTFYSLQLPSSYRQWYNATPPGFLFAVKGPRFITHMKRLRNSLTPLANFFASGVLALGEKLGPILWQLPPNLKFDRSQLRAFFQLLPRNTRAAANLGKQHDRRLKARAFLKIDASLPLRYALEIRHPTFMVPEFFELLREHNIAFVFADSAGKFPYSEDVTADFVYIRLHGAEQLYVSGYRERELDWWATRIADWRNGKQPADSKLLTTVKIDARPRDVFVYFDNDAKVHAPFDAIRLSKRMQPKARRSARRQ